MEIVGKSAQDERGRLTLLLRREKSWQSVTIKMFTRLNLSQEDDVCAFKMFESSYFLPSLAKTQIIRATVHLAGTSLRVGPRKYLFY